MQRFFCTLITIIFLTSLTFAADWPTFHGPKGDNKSPDTGLLQKWPEGGPELLWTVDVIGFGWSSVSISGDRIYTNGNVRRDGKDLTMVFCLDKDGNIIWEKDNGPAQADKQKYPGTRGTPTIEGDFVYDINPFGDVTCFDAKTGDKKWSRNIMKENGATDPWWFLGNSVVIDGDNVISTVGGPKATAAALNKRTGEPVWASPPTANPQGVTTAYTTPYLFDFDGIRVVVVMSEVTVEGVDAKTGKSLFSIPWTNSHRCHCTRPIYHNGHLFLTTGYNNAGAKLFKLTKNANGTIATEEKWYESRFNNHHGGVILIGDHVYGTTHDGTWASINFMTGEIGYLSRAAKKGSVHYADGLLYGLSEDDKTVVLVKPDPKEFIELGRFELPNDAEGKSWAHPVVCNGKLYLRHAQYLYCYDVKR